jgi:hypothetical protein
MNQLEMVSIKQEMISSPEGHSSTGTPIIFFSPTNKIHEGETLLSPTIWPMKTSTDLRLPVHGKGLNTSMSSNTYACNRSPQFPPPSYPAYFYYDDFYYYGFELAPGNANPETALVGVPSDPYVGDGNELQVAVDGGGFTALASGNTFRYTEAGLNYATLHSPEQDKKDNFTSRKLIKKEQDQDISENSLKDDLERQVSTTNGVAVRKSVVISQTDRICVLMDIPNPVIDDRKEFNALQE